MSDDPKIKRSRKKIHEEEVLGFAKAMLDFLNEHYKTLVLDDVINWDSVDDGYVRDASFYSDTIESYCHNYRKPVLRLFLDVIDYHCNNVEMSQVFKGPLLFGRLALVAFLRHNTNAPIAAPPWKDFPRNVIAAEVLDNVFPLWFERARASSYRGIWETGEAYRLMDGKEYEDVISFANNVWTARLV